MISMSSETPDSVLPAAGPHTDNGVTRSHPASAPRPTVIEYGVTAAEREASRIILYERLTGDAARKRATGAEPQGAGLTSEAADKVEYIEIWSTAEPSAGYDFRMYSFGGALVAARSTRVS